MEQVKEHIEIKKQEACPKRKRSVPALRFMDFEGMWTKMRLDSVSAKISDGTHFSPQLYEQGNYKYISSKNIRNGYMILDDVPYVSDEVHKEIYSRCDVQFNDILLTKDGASTGNVCLNELDEEFSLLSSVAMIRCDAKGAINEYVYQYICSPYGQYEIRSTIAGQAITRITLEKLRGYKFSFPSLPEQQKIASFLSAVDEKIQQLTKKKALLEQYKKGVMQQLFSGQLRFKDENGNPYPDWKRGRFSKFIKLYRGSSPRPIVKYVTTDESGVNWIKIGDTKQSENYRISFVSEKITREGSLKSRFVEKGEIILANSMSFGKSYLLEVSGCIYDGWFVLREYEESFDKEFMLQVLNSDLLQRQYLRLSTGGVVQNINSDIVYSTLLFCPVIEEQQKIATYLSRIDTKIEAVNNQITQTQTFKKGLLQRMFV
jgi:type I restriction enzyme S subunit